MAEKQGNSEPKIPEITLNSGYKMPGIGLGCGTSKMPPMEELISIFLKAMEIGYRHFDTASLYGTEEAVGKAVAKALEIGLIQSRDELFITSKLWVTHTHHDLVLPALKQTLQTMGLEYLDLYLIHWPGRVKQGANLLDLQESDALPFDMFGTWKAMEDCSQLGLTKSIGLSNFSVEKISRLLQRVTIPPAINQVEMNVGWKQQNLMTFCKEKGIHVCAWSPLGAYGNSWGSNAVMENQVLKDIATSKGMTISQVALRWVYEQGATPIVKSFNEERMKQNLQIFDWELSQQEKDQILEIPDQHREGRGTIFFRHKGPIKSVQELWDADM